MTEAIQATKAQAKPKKNWLRAILPSQWEAYEPLLRELVSRDVKLRYRRSVLGYLWSLLNPLLTMLIMTLVFSFVFRFTIENYPLYVITGSTMFTFFTESAGGAMNSIIFNGSLLKKAYLPKYIFPLSSVCSSFVTMLFNMAAILIVMVFTRAVFYPTALLFFYPLLCLFVFCMGFGFLLSSITVYFRDMQHLWGVITTGWMYLTPIFWPVSMLPEEYQWVENLNPMFIFIDCFREVLVYGHLPSAFEAVSCFGWAALALVLGILQFRKLQKEFVLHI
jgi:ABC-2 type transport system permease protein